MTPKINDLKSRIGDVRAKLRALEAELADAKREYGEAEIAKAGIVINETRVRATQYSPPRFVSGFHAIWANRVRVRLVKPKKDGSPSRASAGSWFLSDIIILDDEG